MDSLGAKPDIFKATQELRGTRDITRFYQRYVAWLREEWHVEEKSPGSVPELVAIVDIENNLFINHADAKTTRRWKRVLHKLGKEYRNRYTQSLLGSK